MKKFLVAFAVLLFVLTVSAEQKNLFAAASVKKIDGVTAMVSGLDIQVNADADSLKKFIKNDFYKAFGLGKNIEPQLFRAVQIGDASIYKFVPFYKGIKVDGVYTVVTMRNGKIDRINNGLSDIDIDITKMIPESEALKSAMAVRNMKVMPKNYSVEKIITRYFGKFVPAYKVRFAPVTLADSRYHIVDALTGRVIKSSHSTFFAEGDETDTGDIAPAPDDDNGDSGDSGSDEPVAPKKECDGTETNMAKIWKFNPVITPELTEVELPWVASYDDNDLTPELIGTLITEEDSKGRKIKAYNCPDDDEVIDIDFGGFKVSPHVCHPMPLANKCENGSFIYDDCDGGHEFSKESIKIDKIDKCAEISMYYHASKIYDYMRTLHKDIAVDDFHLQTNEDGNSLNVISNFTMPEISMENFQALMDGSNELAPFDNAFFTQNDPTMSMLLDQFGIDGDLLVFGQGTKADFGYDGDVVYHEFGHATIYTTGITGLEFQDKYGLTVEPGALHEGMADTFAFIMTDNTCTGEYASEGFVKADPRYKASMDIETVDGKEIYCMRSALNKKKVFEDFIGEAHWDGQPLLASNWDIYQLIKGDDKDTQKHRDNLAKLILKALYTIGDADVSYKLWAETLMAEVEKDENFKGKAKEIRKILEDRNFFTEARARSVNEKITDTMYIPAGSSSSENDPTGGMLGGGASGISVLDGDEEVKIGPAYIQYYFDVPADAEKDALKLKATVQANSSDSMLGGLGGGTTSKPELEIYYRKGAPVEYGADGKVEKDGKSAGDATKGWYVRNVEKGERYYIQFVNRSSAAVATAITVEVSDAPAEESDEAEEDSDADGADDGMSYDDDAKKGGKKASKSKDQKSSSSSSETSSITLSGNISDSDCISRIAFVTSSI